MSSSHFITQAGVKKKKESQSGGGSIFQYCLLHWPPTLSHIIAVDTEKTNDSHVGNMGLVDRGGSESRSSEKVGVG